MAANEGNTTVHSNIEVFKLNRYTFTMIQTLLSNQHIILTLKASYDIDVATITLLPLGADMDASVYKVESLKQASFFVKLKRGSHHNISLEIVELLHKTGVPVILPINTNHGQRILRLEDFTLIVYPYIDGQDGFNRPLSDEQWMQLGKALRKVHEIHVPDDIETQIRHETFSPKWRELVRSFYAHFESKVFQDEIKLDEIAIKLLNFIQDNILIIKRLVERSEQLAQELRTRSHPFVLCHADIHGGNVFMDKQDKLYIVDWDNPIMAPKERDLMFIGGGVAGVWNQAHEEELFYKGYGETSTNKRLLAYYRHERIVEDIALYVQGLLLSTDGGDDRPVMYKQFIDMFQPRNVIDIAFKTDL